MHEGSRQAKTFVFFDSASAEFAGKFRIGAGRPSGMTYISPAGRKDFTKDGI